MTKCLLWGTFFSSNRRSVISERPNSLFSIETTFSRILRALHSNGKKLSATQITVTRKPETEFILKVTRAYQRNLVETCTILLDFSYLLNHNHRIHRHLWMKTFSVSSWQLKTCFPMKRPKWTVPKLSIMLHESADRPQKITTYVHIWYIQNKKKLEERKTLFSTCAS